MCEESSEDEVEWAGSCTGETSVYYFSLWKIDRPISCCTHHHLPKAKAANSCDSKHRACSSSVPAPPTTRRDDQTCVDRVSSSSIQ